MSINMIIDILPEISTLIMAIIFIIFSTKLLPLLKSGVDDNQIKVIKQWAEFLVESAERWEISNKINNVSKKDYVMNKLMDIVKKNGYCFTEDQLDDIRRAAVIIYENTYNMAKITVDALLDGVGNEKA